MNPAIPKTQSVRIATAAVLLLAVAAATLLAAPVGSEAAAKKRSCKDVVVQFEPEGSGGVTEIKVKHIKCKPARKILRKCIGGTLENGWSGTYANDRFHLRHKKQRINYLPVGGGGCIPVRVA